MDKTLKEIIAVLIKIPQADCIPVKMPSIISLQKHDSNINYIEGLVSQHIHILHPLYIRASILVLLFEQVIYLMKE